MAKSKYFTFEEIAAREWDPSTEGKSATQVLEIYRSTVRKQRPTVLECGTRQGYSTTALAEACEETGGTLVSVDIDDCIDVVQSANWVFVQSDDRDVERVIERAPILAEGIDVLYIDSKHTRSHVEEVLMSWYPFLNAESYVFFDDIDPTPYARRRRKDDLIKEIEWSHIGRFTRDFFYANEDQLFLSHHFGTTGMAKMYKLSPLGTVAHVAVPVPNRDTPGYRALKRLKQATMDLRARRHT